MRNTQPDLCFSKPERSSRIRSFVVPEISICRVKYKRALALFWRPPLRGRGDGGGPSTMLHASVGAPRHFCNSRAEHRGTTAGYL